MCSAAGGGGVLTLIQVHLLECKVCFERFSGQEGQHAPQNLPCGHVLCQQCVWALAPPPLGRLLCPFCRQACGPQDTSPCRVLGDLQGLLQTPRALPHARRLECWGGWGTLVNPSGVAALGSSGSTVVVHDGEKRLVVFSRDGRTLRSFGEKRGPGGVCYPADVAVTSGGSVVVTDPGERAVKVFTCRGAHLLTVSGHFLLPWGVDTDARGHILVSDLQAGTLSLIKVDVQRGAVLECGLVVRGLRRPGSVSCGGGRTAVMERLDAGARLTLLSRDFRVLLQTDGFSATLRSGVRLKASAAVFSWDGALLLIDSDHGTIWRLDTPEDPSLLLTPVVTPRLLRPVAVVTSQHRLMVLDAGDHTLKMFSSELDHD